MNRGVGALIMSIALAIVITAATLPDRQTVGVINALATGTVHLTEASLGQRP